MKLESPLHSEMSSASESRAEKYPAPIPVDAPVAGRRVASSLRACPLKLDG